jgi:hypothetical protein
VGILPASGLFDALKAKGFEQWDRGTVGTEHGNAEFVNAGL